MRHCFLLSLQIWRKNEKNTQPYNFYILIIILFFFDIFDFREGSVPFSYKTNSNPLAEAEYHKNVIVRDVARNFGRQHSSTAEELLFGGSVTACEKTQSPCISIKSTPTTNYIDMDDEKENNYMSPIVSISWMNWFCIILVAILYYHKD